MMDEIEETPHKPKKDSFQLELEAKMEERRGRGFGAGFSPRDSNNSSYSKDEDNLPHVGMDKHKAMSGIESKQKSFNFNDTLRFDSTRSIFDKHANIINKTSDTDFSLKSNQYRSPLRSNDISGRNSEMKRSLWRDSNIEDVLNSSTDSTQTKKEFQSNRLEMLPEHSLSRKGTDLSSSEDQSLLAESLQSCSETDLPRHRFLKSTKTMQEAKNDKRETTATPSPIPTPRIHKTDSVSSPANKNSKPSKSLSDILGENGFSEEPFLETSNQKSKYNSLQKLDESNEDDINSSLREEPGAFKTKDSISESQRETLEADAEDKAPKKKFSNYYDDDDDDDILSSLLKRKSSKAEETVQKMAGSVENEKGATEYQEENFKSENHFNDNNSEERSEISKNGATALLDGSSIDIDKPKVKPRKQRRQSEQSERTLSPNNQQEDFAQLADLLSEDTKRKESVSKELQPQSLQTQKTISNVETKTKTKQKDTKISFEDPPKESDVTRLREETFKKWRQVKDKKIKEIQKQKEKDEVKKINEQKEKLSVATVSFNVWKQQKDPLLKTKLKLEKQKEEEKKKKENEEKINKIQGAKECFNAWKESKDKILKEKWKSKQENERLKMQKANEEKSWKEKKNTGAFLIWKQRKENILHEAKLNQKQKLEMTLKEKETIKLEKEMLSYASYKQWLIRKEENEKEATSKKQQQNMNYFEPKLAWRPPSRTMKWT
ncbi:microtubule-associated protein 9 isoform X2 [Octopus sinensis]|uniref:Microtubule-associated protein 9 isoform X2 n=1 Tax=Octopus sinensis TaxID=2607531 RepID=A0A6P7UC77_9MOLL|nr:microtubule-associated protein 9 isoform X2 [Octopus sinensis]